MTETLLDPSPAPPPRPSRRLERDDNDKLLAGVCAGFGRYTGTDPVIWRITLAVLTVFGGVGAVIYALGWIFMPKATEATSPGERLLTDRRFRPRGRTLTVLLAVVLGILVIAALQDHAGGGLAVLAVVVVFILTMRHLNDRKAAGHYEAGAMAPSAPMPAAAAGLAPAVVRTPRRPRSKLGQITLSAAILVSGVLIALRLNGVDALTAPRIIAVALIVVAGGLVVGTWIGRARWLIPIAALLALAIAPAAVAENAVAAGAGDRTWTPTAASVSASGSPHYSLGVGEGRIDLSNLSKEGLGTPIFARVRIGHLLVIAPSALRLHVVAHVGLGDVVIDTVRHSGSRVDQDVTVGPAGGPTQELNLRVDVGQVEVRRG